MNTLLKFGEYCALLIAFVAATLLALSFCLRPPPTRAWVGPALQKDRPIGYASRNLMDSWSEIEPLRQRKNRKARRAERSGRR